MRLLFLTQRLPYAPNRGDRLRAWHILRKLARSHEVTVGSLVHDEEEASHVEELSGIAAGVIVGRVSRIANTIRGAVRLAGSQPLTLSLLDSPELRARLADHVAARQPDLVLAFCSSTARFALEPPLSGIPLVVDMVDADSAKWRDLAPKSRWPMSWVYRREARTLGAFEARAMHAARTTFVVNERERDELVRLAPDARVLVVPNGIDLTYFARPAANTVPVNPPTVIFCGVMNYGPNAEGATWLAREVWPLVRARVPEARLQVVGASPTPAVTSLADEANGVEVTGSVDDVRPYLWRASVAAAPLHTARGVQNKVLEALAAGLPCVVTPAVEGGLPTAVKTACPVGDGAGAFADALVGLLGLSPDARLALAARADLAALGWETQLARLDEIVADALSGPQ